MKALFILHTKEWSGC